MTSVESLPNYGALYQNEHVAMAENGIRVSWSPKVGEALGLTFDLSEFEGHDLQDIKLAIEIVGKYILMPAIEDDFPTDQGRHEWIRSQAPELSEAYGFNRLRRNKIGTAKMSMDLAAIVFQRNNDPRYHEVQKLHNEVNDLLGKEDVFKTSLGFADKLVGASVDFLKLFSGEYVPVGV